MIFNKLHQINQQYFEQALGEKARLEEAIFLIDKEILKVKDEVADKLLSPFGKVRDLKMISLHREILKEKEDSLLKEKSKLREDIELIKNKIQEYHQESEKYEHLIMLEQKKQLLKQVKLEELASEELIQSRGMM